ncbi:hypothetical protein ACSD7O_24815 [Methylorubrum extorquens]|uniref:hypothetical protein n=1 Tax=Methylorubrum extorquens TaxID=408 RepID=UPI003F62DA8B
MPDHRDQRVTRAFKALREPTERQDNLVSEAQRARSDRQAQKAILALKASQVPQD